jgi:hypothetical protein
MRKAQLATIVYKRGSNIVGGCEYRHAKIGTAQLVQCGLPAYEWKSPHHKVFFLCQEHGDFIADALDRSEIAENMEAMK